MKKLLAWLAVLSVLALGCAAAEDALRLDALMDEIEALQAAADKAVDVDWDFTGQRPSTTFYTGERSYQENLMYIWKYDLLHAALGGKPTFTYTVSGPSPRIGLNIGDVLWSPGSTVGIILVYLSVDGESNAIIPEETAGKYLFVVSMTWGSIREDLPMAAEIKPFDGPALNGMRTVDKYTADTGETYALDVIPDPEDWAFEGFQLQVNLGAGGDTWDHLTFESDYSGAHPRLLITFDQAGIYTLDVILNARSPHDVDILHHHKLIKACIGGAVDPEEDTGAIHLSQEAIDVTLKAGTPCPRLGKVAILNFGALSGALGGAPSFTCGEADGSLGLNLVQKENGLFEVWLTADGQTDAILPEDETGVHGFTVTFTWGSLTAELPVWVEIVPQPIQLSPRILHPYLYVGQRDGLLADYRIVQADELRETQGGEPAFSSTSSGRISAQAAWNCDDTFSVYVMADGRDGPFTEDLAGTYDITLTITWGSLSRELLLRVRILPFPGTPWTGVLLPPDQTLRPGETFTFTVGTDPEGWSAEGLRLFAEPSCGDEALDAHMQAQAAGDDRMTWTLSFDQPGVYSVLVRTYAYRPATGGIVFQRDGAFTVTVAEDTPPQPLELTLAESQAVHEISPDGKSIFISRPTISGGQAPYTVAYNCYDAQSNPVNYYYSDDERTAMSPGRNGHFIVFVVVRDSAGAVRQIDTGWHDLTGYADLPLTLAEETAVSEISPDGRSIFITRPTASGGTGRYTYAYNCYDTESNPVNYYYSDDWRTAMTPGYEGRFCVFVVVSDGVNSVTINTGWYQLSR